MLTEKKMHNHLIKTIAGLLILTLLMTSCKDDQPNSEQIQSIKTITVRQTNLERVRKFAGIVKATETSQLSFEVGGMVQLVHVDIGNHVGKGQELAVLDSEPYKLAVDAAAAELDKAQANVVNTQANYERQQRVYDQGAGTKSKLDQAKYEYNAAQSSVTYCISQKKLAERNLRKTSLVAPYEGYIAARYVEPHEEIPAGQRMFEIDAVGTLEVTLAVPETTIAQIHTGTAATVTFPTLPGQSVTGKITEIGSAAIKANAFPVKLALIDPPAAINPGMTAEASLVLSEEDQPTGFLIPLQSLLPSEEPGHGYVFVYDPVASVVKKTPVRSRGSEKNMVVIEEGLAPGDIIAEAGVTFLADGMKVKLSEQ
jgi:RND family efflux transporter MFP subunit